MKKVITFLLLSLPCLAATHWVSPTGAAAWSSCVGASPLSGTSACSWSSAQSNAAAGDLVYIRAGTYDMTTNDWFSPAHSGNGTSLPNNMIKFWAYTAETPTFMTSGTQVNAYLFDLNGISYVSLRGITFDLTNLEGFGDPGGVVSVAAGAHYIDIGFNTFQSTTGAREIFWGPVNSSDVSTYGWTTHIWIHDNHFNYSGKANGGAQWQSGCTDGGSDSVRFGQPGGSFGGTVIQDMNDTVENNFFEHAEHAQIDTYASKMVIRNNTFHNEPWSSGCTSGTNGGALVNPATYDNSSYNGKYGHRNFQITEDYNRTQTFDLIEGNRIGYGSVNQGNDGAEDFDIAAPSNIIRYNFFFASFGNGAMFKYDFNSGIGSGGHGGTYNRLYNNTFFHNGYGYQTTGTGGSCDNCPWPLTSITTYVGTSGLGNVFKNNLLWQNAGYSLYPGAVGGQSDVLDRNENNGWSQITSPSNNYCGGGAQTNGGGCSDVTGRDPLFNNTDVSNPANSQTLPDMTLKASSPAIDGGTYLTTATNSGAGATSLTVADAMYFQDATWGSSLALVASGLGGTMQPDSICVGTVANCAQISSVAYGTYNSPAGTITLASPLTWSNGAHIWLYKKSDGTVVLNGTAPDYGAAEYDSGSTYTITVTTPSNGSVTDSQGLISCPSTCTTSVASGNDTLTTTPAANYTYGIWGGGTCSGSDAVPCVVSGTVTVTASFVLNTTPLSAGWMFAKNNVVQSNTKTH